MGKPTMDGRERMKRMFRRQDQDRVPRHESFWGETITRFQEEGFQGGYEDVLTQLVHTDIHAMGWLWPQCFPGDEKLISEDAETKVIRESNGRIARYWKHKSGTPEHIGFECDGREAWETRFKPALLKNWRQLNPADYVRHLKEGRDKGRWCHLTGVESFEETRQIIGDEVVLIAMAEDPEWVMDISRTFTDIVLRNFDLVMETGIQPDGVFIYGDMAFNHATLCSPAMYKELIWPDHKRMADWAHKHNMKFIYHTDGNINGVMDLYLEAGFDCLQPLEAKAHVDIRKLIPMYGDKLAFFGNCDVMQYATNDRDLIAAEIKAKLDAGKAGKGYVYHSDHSVPPQVSLETYKFIIDCVDKYGQYD